MNLNEKPRVDQGGVISSRPGFQLPDWSRRGFFESHNFGGTFYFSGLDGTPSASRTHSSSSKATATSRCSRSSSHLHQGRLEAGAGLSLSFGLRYDWQNYFHDNNNVAPRSRSRTRGQQEDQRVPRRHRRLQRSQRSGGDHRRAALAAGGLIKYVITDPGYPIVSPPRQPAAAQPPRIVRLRRTSDSADGSVQRRAGSPTEQDIDGLAHLHVRARLSPVPLAPTSTRRRRSTSRVPIRRYGVVRQVESTGRQETDSLQVTVRAAVAAGFNGQMQYTLSSGYKRYERHQFVFRPTTTTYPGNGRAPTSTGAIASTCSAARASSCSTSAWGSR